MASFLSSLIKKKAKKTPEEVLREEMSEVLAEMPVFTMMPEVREAIDNDELAVVELHDGGKESSMLMLNEDEQCLFFEMAIRLTVKQELDRYETRGESYGSTYRRERFTSQVMYRNKYNSQVGLLAVTDKRALFVPQRGQLSQSGGVLSLDLYDILSIEVRDDILLTITTAANTYQVYTKYPEYFRKVAMIARKSTKIRLAKDIKTLEGGKIQ